MARTRPYKKKGSRSAWSQGGQPSSKRRVGFRGPRKYSGFRGKFSNARTGGFLGIELKFLDVTWNGVTISTSTDGADGEMLPSAGCTGCISAPVQGDGEQERDGRKYTIKAVSFSGTISTSAAVNQADAADAAGYYVCLVHDKQTNASTMVSENVFINPGTTAFSMLPFPLRNLQNSKRFRILDSKYIRPGDMYAITDGTNTGSLSNQTSPTFSLSWHGNMQVNSVGTTANVSSVSDNSISVIMYTANTLGTPVLYGKSRVRFVG